MNIPVSWPEDHNFPAEEADSERPLAVTIEVGETALERGSVAFTHSSRDQGWCQGPGEEAEPTTAPLDVCSADLGKADTLVPDGLSVRGKSWEGRREERHLVWRQKAQPEWKARSGSNSVCRRSGRSQSVGSKGRLSCVEGWGQVTEGRGGGPALSRSRAGRARVNYASGVTGD